MCALEAISTIKVCLTVVPYRCVHLLLPVISLANRFITPLSRSVYLCSSVNWRGSESPRSEQLGLLEDGRSNDGSAQDGLAEGSGPQGWDSNGGIHLDCKSYLYRACQRAVECQIIMSEL